MKIVERLSDLVHVIERILAIVFLIIMSSLLAAGVIFRYFLNNPLPWSDEVAMFSLVWITFLGGSMAIKRQQLAAVTLFLDRMHGNIRRTLMNVGLASILFFCMYLLYISISWLLSPTISFEKSNALQIPMIFPYLSVPIGLSFMSIHSLNILLLSLKTPTPVKVITEQVSIQSPREELN